MDYKVKETEIKYSDLVTIISGLYFGADEDLSNTEDLIDFLNENEDSTAVIQSLTPFIKEAE
ncbi:hypothetical protein [Enterococcus italicus]|uniref:hypothetical protein n=1 Tax=Enterococcus italicus TaxID=246144 RepID=UPI003F467611